MKEKYKILKSVPFQLCPKCNGEGKIIGIEYDLVHGGSEYSRKCPVCKGNRIIPMSIVE